jgi:L-malate glycosyltransferase
MHSNYNMYSTGKIAENLAEQSYWDNSYTNYQFNTVPEQDEIRQWIEKYVPPTLSGKCFEVGCYPGRFLSIFGKLGYELNGIDTTNQLDIRITNWLLQSGYKVGKIERENFFKYTSNDKFDVVTSFGFIEHFNDWELLFKMHADLTAPAGYLVIEVPNFRGMLQRLIHKYLDTDNYKRHNIDAMKPQSWRKLLEANGFDILFCGYIGTFSFWLDRYPETQFKQLVNKKLQKHQRFLSRLFNVSSISSPYIGIIAKRK